LQPDPSRSRIHPLGVIGSALALVAFALVACDEPAAPAAAPPSRVNAVTEVAPKAPPLAEFCDVLHEPGQGAALRLPPVEGTPRAGPGAFRWVNVWATWCKPCVEEIPRIAGFCDKLAHEGTPVAFELLSVDADAAVVDGFRKEHADIPPGLRLSDASALQPWLAELGLDQGAGLPIHVFVEKTSNVRCVRAGAVSENDYGAVAALVK
jgi:thiol-disulfide isomerase/thioredoxin